MKVMIFAAILFPLFASAQTSLNTEQNSADSEMSADILGGWRKGARCGRHSDNKCLEHRVFETCDYDNSHGIYGSCRDIGKRDNEVICSCR